MTAQPLSAHRDRVIMMVLKVSTWVYGHILKKKAADHKGPIKHRTNETEKKGDVMCS